MKGKQLESCETKSELVLQGIVYMVTGLSMATRPWFSCVFQNKNDDAQMGHIKILCKFLYGKCQTQTVAGSVLLTLSAETRGI